MFISIKHFVFLVALFAVTACQSEAETITIGDQSFQVSYAVTDEEKEKGLMFVEGMPADEGMVFLYPYERILKFWMKNTLIPLDMLFFDKEMRLVHIEESATPHDLMPRGPNKPTCIVVEINGGQAKEQNIQIGDVLSLNRPYKCLQSSDK